MIRVVLADDEPLTRAGIRTVVQADPGIEVVGEAADGAAAVDLARQHRPDVVLLDIVMPGTGGLAAAAELHRELPEIGVIMLTTFSEDEYITGALAAGASGFLLKAGDPEDLFAGIRAVAAGAAYLSPKVAHRVIRQLRTGGKSRAQDRVATLTPREREVLALLGAGLSNADIAARLDIVEGTVKVFVSSVLRRLEVRNRVQAAILAHEAGLVES